MDSEEVETLIKLCRSLRGVAVRTAHARIQNETQRVSVSPRDAHSLAAAVDLASAIDMGNPVFVSGAMREAKKALDATWLHSH